MTCLSESFVASISQSLNATSVPCVLWGHYSLLLYGIPSVVGSIDFVVPDGLTSAGLRVLSKIKSLNSCPDEKRCPSTSSDRFSPAPTCHLHVDDSEVTVGLFPQADVLWFLPDLDNSLLFPKKSSLPPSFILASDNAVLPAWRPGRGSGVFSESGDKVVALKPHVLLEAFMRIYARDADTRVGSFGLAMVGYIDEYVDSDGFLDVTQVSEPFRTFYEELKYGSKPVRAWSLEFRKALQV